MNIRIKPLLYIFVSILLVFSVGGYFYYIKIAPASLQQQFAELNYSTVNVKEDIDEKNQVLTFHVNEDIALSDAVSELNKIMKESEYAQYTLQVSHTNETEQLTNVWNELQYDVYEIIGQKKFRELPTLPLKISEQFPNVNISINMNAKYVFVSLSDGEENLHRLLPVESTDVRAWAS